MVCGVEPLHAASRACSWCIWYGPSPRSAGWRSWSWGSCWAPAAQAAFGSATAALALFYPSSFSIDLSDSYCNIIAMTYSNYSSDDIQWQDYIAINIIQFNSLAILAWSQIPLRYTLDFPILLHHPPSSPRSLDKSNRMGGFYLCLRQDEPRLSGLIHSSCAL